MYCYFCKREYKNPTRHEQSNIHKKNKEIYPNHGYCSRCCKVVDNSNEQYSTGPIFCYDIPKHSKSIHHIERCKEIRRESDELVDRLMKDVETDIIYWNEFKTKHQ